MAKKISVTLDSEDELKSFEAFKEIQKSETAKKAFDEFQAQQKAQKELCEKIVQIIDQFEELQALAEEVKKKQPSFRPPWLKQAAQGTQLATAIKKFMTENAPVDREKIIAGFKSQFDVPKIVKTLDKRAGGKRPLWTLKDGIYTAKP
jgi:predicted RNA-binding Zn ribbon-like protein